MKYFALIFLFGLATASLLEIYPNSDEEDFLLKADDSDKGKDDVQTELGRKLRETLKHILKEIKKTVEEGKDVSQDLIDQARDLVNKLKEYGINVSDEAKDLLAYLKNRVQRWAKELLDILRDNSSTVHRADSAKTELGKKLRQLLDHIVDRVKQSVEEGRHISQDLLDKAKEVARKLKDYGVHISNDVKNVLEELKGKYSEWAKDLLDIIHGKKFAVSKEDDVKTELGQKLRDALKRLMKRIKQAVEEGRHVKQELIEEAKDLVRRLRQYGLDVGDEVKDMAKYLKERVRNWLQELVDIIRGDNSTVSRAEGEDKTGVADRLRDEFRRLVKRIKQAVEEGKHISQRLLDEAKDLVRRLKEYGVNVKDEVKDMLQYIKKRYTEWLQEFLDIIHGKSSTL